jgi:hypothetical protein
LQRTIQGTTWQWGADDTIKFLIDGEIANSGWSAAGLVTTWKAIDSHTVILCIDRGRAVNRYAVLIFDADMNSYSGYGFEGYPSLLPTNRILGGKPHIPDSKQDRTESGGISIIKAEYGVAGRWVDVTEQAKKILSARRSLPADATSLGISDPANGFRKTLKVQYVIDGHIFVVSAADGGEIKMPTEND